MRRAAKLRASRHAEDRDRRHELLGLGLQALCPGGTFLHQGSVLLRGLVHLAHGVADLLDAVGLLGARRRDPAMMPLTRRTEATSSSMVLPARSTRPVPVRPASTLRLISDLISLGSLGAALRQRAHFAGHHGKATALLTGAGGFHAAFSARMLVWKAMPSITPMMSPMRGCCR